ncbi:MAG TPA: NERD domain-containing protein [Thermoplasmata archaeon]|nr:NERD domain-containing protein [Thermoplasmata archaeon]
MGLLVFSAGPPDDAPERRQVETLLPTLDQEFSKGRVDCTVFINVRLPVAWPNQIDLLAIRGNAFILIDFKDFSGKVYADCGPKGHWVVHRPNQPPWAVDRVNPFHQAERHRKLFTNYVLSAFPPRDAVAHNQGNRAYNISKSVKSWVVVEPGTEVILTGIDEVRAPWFRIVPLDQLAHDLALERSASEVVPPGRTLEIAKHFGATERRKWRDWYLPPTGVDLSLNSASQRFDAISALLGSALPEDMTRGIRDVGRLNLTSYLPEIVRIANEAPSAVRIDAIYLLDSWKSELPRKKSVEWLFSDDAQLRAWAWSFVEATRNTAAAEPLLRFLQTCPEGERLSALRLFLTLGTDDAHTKLLNLGNIWREKNRELKEPEWACLVEGLGARGYREGGTLVLRILEDSLRSLDSRGSGDLEELVNQCIKTLGLIGDQASFTVLKRMLGLQDGEWDGTILRSIGHLGAPEGFAVVLPFIHSPSDRVRNAARNALCHIDGPSAVVVLWDDFVAESTEGRRAIELTEELARASADLFETRLLEALRKEEHSLGTKDSFLWSLCRVVTDRAIRVVRPFMGQRETWMEASNVLSSPKLQHSILSLVESTHNSANEYERASHVVLAVRGGASIDIAHLKDHEQDDSSLVRVVVADMYGAFRSDYTRSRLEILVDDPDPRVSASAAQGLVGPSTNWLSSCEVAIQDRHTRHASVIFAKSVVVLMVESESGQSPEHPIVLRTEDISYILPFEIPLGGAGIALTSVSRNGPVDMVVLLRSPNLYFARKSLGKCLDGLANRLPPSTMQIGFASGVPDRFKPLISKLAERPGGH